MYKFKFDTTKMSWTKTAIINNDSGLTKLVIRFTDTNYFNNVLPILKNLVNINYRLVLSRKNDKSSWDLNLIRLVGYDLVEQKFRGNPSKENNYIECVVLEGANWVTELSNYNIHLIYS